jgi:drug/metabolite transporter (DMT)-like permease
LERPVAQKTIGSFFLIVTPALLTTLFWALGGAASYRLTRLMGPESANFWRLLLAAVLLGTWVHATGANPWVHGGLWLILSGVVGFGIGDIALYYALPRLGSRLTILMVQCLAAPIGISLGWALLDETLTGTQLLASGLILTGVGVALAPGSHSVPHGHLGAGILWGMLAAAGQAGGALLSRHAMELSHAAGRTLNGIEAAYGRIWGGVAIAGIYLVFVIARGGSNWFSRKGEPTPEPKKFLPWLALTALLGPVIGVSCYQLALRDNNTGLVLAIVATTPLVVMPIAWWLEGDKPGWRALVGGAVAVVGVVLLAN